MRSRGYTIYQPLQTTLTDWEQRLSGGTHWSKKARDHSGRVRESSEISIDNKCEYYIIMHHKVLITSFHTVKLWRKIVLKHLGNMHVISS